MNQTTYFQISVISKVALINLSGIWTKEIAQAYHKEVLLQLDYFKHKKVFPISNMVNWSIPSLEVMEITNKISQEVAATIDFRYSVLLTQKQHLQLFEDVMNQFNLAQTDTVAKAFTSLEAALNWGKKMGYDVSNVPLDYFKRSYQQY